MLDDTTQEESCQEGCSDATKTKSQDSGEQGGGGINGRRNEEAKGQDKLQDQHKELAEIVDPWPIRSWHKETEDKLGHSVQVSINLG